MGDNPKPSVKEMGQEQLVAAYELVAEEYGENFSTVRRAYEKFKELLGDDTQ